MRRDEVKKPTFAILCTTLLVLYGSVVSAMETNPRPMPRPTHLTGVAAPTPCAIILTDQFTGKQHYDDGTPVGLGILPKTNYASPQQAWAFIYTTIIHSPSARGMTYTPACFKR